MNSKTFVSFSGESFNEYQNNVQSSTNTDSKLRLKPKDIRNVLSIIETFKADPLRICFLESKMTSKPTINLIRDSCVDNTIADWTRQI